MHMEQAQCDQAKMELKNKSWLDQKRTITINSDHDVHSHKEWTSTYVQNSTNVTTLGNCIKDIKSNKSTRVMYLKKCITFNNKY